MNDIEGMELPRPPLISVVLSTHNRAYILQKTLLTMQLQTPSCDWELVVVDNASTDQTPVVLASMCACLPLRILREPRLGKSRAINLAMAAAKGKLVVFTDDDVRPGPAWLAEYQRAYHQYPTVDIFCGAINSLFPVGAPAWLASCPHASPLFAKFAPMPAEGYLPPDLLPFGGNFAVRSALLAEITLNEQLGPPNKIMGEDTDFLARLKARSQDIIYLPLAGLDHYIREEQLVLSNIFARAFTCGTSMIEVMNSVDIVAPIPESDDLAARYFNLGADLNYSYGQLYQLSVRGGDQREQMLADHIAALNWSGESALLADRARSWLLQNPDRVPNMARRGFLSTATSRCRDTANVETGDNPARSMRVVVS